MREAMSPPIPPILDEELLEAVSALAAAAHITEIIIRSLRKDIYTVGPMLQLMSGQVEEMKSFPPPPMKRRSIHNWIAKKINDAIRIETEFLEWRKDMLGRISRA
jgi:hypothetical protein